MNWKKNPPAWVSPIVPVSGLFAVTFILLMPLIGSPVNADTEKTSMFSGDSESIPTFISRIVK